MKIQRGKAKGVTVRLGREETKTWESGTEAASKLKHKVREDATKYAQEHQIEGPRNGWSK